MIEEKQRNVTKTISLTPEQLDKLNAIGVDKFNGNDSMACVKAIEAYYDSLYVRG
jgi:hypothetical protein